MKHEAEKTTCGEGGEDHRTALREGQNLNENPESKRRNA
jgi:hypothetical protein